jgi:malyl-CoA/(S)-citramalyl-CoA lyase
MLGYEGKWAIHPSQVPLANDVFTPDAHVIDRTRRIVAAMREAARNGSGAVSLDGRLIDAASIRMAETLLAKLEQIEAKESGVPAAVPPLRAVAGEPRAAAERVLAPFADF